MQWYPEKVALQVCPEEDVFQGVVAGRDETMLYLAGTWRLFVAEVWAAIDVGRPALPRCVSVLSNLNATAVIGSLVLSICVRADGWMQFPLSNQISYNLVV
jgi:hypothetical protein